MKRKNIAVIDPRGQWAHPGKHTIVPTSDGRITMRGVPYPVYGEDETGYGQMMYPGGEYQFSGQMVYEKPMMQIGGLWNSNRSQWVDSINNANIYKNFVQRQYLQNGPSIQIPGQPGRSTHFMEESDGMVYPTVVQRPGSFSLEYLNKSDKNAAYNYAKMTGQFIKFPTAEQAAWYAGNGYKTGTGVTIGKYEDGGKMIRRADGSYSRRGLWDNIRANIGSKNAPTKEMLEQDRKIRLSEKAFGGGVANGIFLKDIDNQYYMEYFKNGGGIPERYRNMGFSKVGQKKQSTRPGKKWMVLAKKGDEYKVVHGGYKGMQDYTQHGSEKRRDNFWNRMGGKDSAKAKDPFSPLYWHKRLGTWQSGGLVEDYLKEARSVQQVPQGYNYLGESAGKKVYGRTLEENKLSELKAAVSSNNTSSNDNYNNYIINLIRQGYSPEELVDKKYISNAAVNQFSKYYTAPVKKSDYVYTQDMVKSIVPTPEPIQAFHGEHLFGIDNKALGAVKWETRDSPDAASHQGGKQGYLQDALFRFYKPNSSEIDYSRPMYRVPADVFSNKVTYGTNKVNNLDELLKYAVGDNAGEYKMGGQPCYKCGGKINKFQDGGSFGQAFANARKAGLSTFIWRGKNYTTKLADEESVRHSVSKQTPVKRQSTPIANTRTVANIATANKNTQKQGVKQVVIDKRNVFEKFFNIEDDEDITRFDLPEDVYSAYQQHSKSNTGKNFGIVSKKNARAYFFDEDGRLAVQDEVGLGKDRGEAQPVFYQVKTTPSGTYRMEKPEFIAPVADKILKGYDANNFFYIDNVDPSKRLIDAPGSNRPITPRQAMHGIPNHLKKERSKAFDNQRVDDNYMSAGCINCRKEFLDNPYFDNFSKGFVYVLPEKKLGGNFESGPKPKNGYIDIKKTYNIDPLSRKGIEKAKALEKMYPGTKFVCDENGCAAIAGKAARAYGVDFGYANAWDYGNKNNVIYQNPEYADMITGDQGVLPNPKNYKVPEQVLNAKNVLVGLNRKNNLVTDGGTRVSSLLEDVARLVGTGKAKERRYANDSYDYANPELYPNSRGYEHVGYMLGDKKMLHGTGKSGNHPAFYVIDDVQDGVNLSGYGKYQPVEMMTPRSKTRRFFDKMLSGEFKNGGLTKYQSRPGTVIDLPNNSYSYAYDNSTINEQPSFVKPQSIDQNVLKLEDQESDWTVESWNEALKHINRKERPRSFNNIYPLNKDIAAPMAVSFLGSIADGMQKNNQNKQYRDRYYTSDSLYSTVYNAASRGRDANGRFAPTFMTPVQFPGNIYDSYPKYGFQDGGSLDITSGVFGLPEMNFDSSEFNRAEVKFPETAVEKMAESETGSAPESSSYKVPSSTSSSTNSLKEYIISRESGGNYQAQSKKSSAVGAYQFLWKQHAPWIKDVTGVRSKNEFLHNPQAQDTAFDYWNQQVLTPWAQKIKQTTGTRDSLNTIKKRIHFAGPGGAMKFYTTGEETVDAYGTKTSQYKQGGEYELTDTEIKQILANGGSVEYL